MKTDQVIADLPTSHSKVSCNLMSTADWPKKSSFNDIPHNALDTSQDIDLREFVIKRFELGSGEIDGAVVGEGQFLALSGSRIAW